MPVVPVADAKSVVPVADGKPEPASSVAVVLVPIAPVRPAADGKASLDAEGKPVPVAVVAVVLVQPPGLVVSADGMPTAVVLGTPAAPVVVATGRPGASADDAKPLPVAVVAPVTDGRPGVALNDVGYPRTSVPPTIGAVAEPVGGAVPSSYAYSITTDGAGEAEGAGLEEREMYFLTTRFTNGDAASVDGEPEVDSSSLIPVLIAATSERAGMTP